MGNQLVGVAPSQIFPVEHYFTHHPNLRFDKNLGSTRFFKVARAESSEGLIVVKVFVLHDLSILLQPYQQRVEEIRTKLDSAFNCLPFRKAILGNGAAFLMREYVKYNLYDRISTRPFLAPIEKKWIAFQILCALHQSHKVGVCHGDIKLENITVTAWHWVLLTDFASFKPTLLPNDNPSEFSFFFDTSRRRTCYIAPERFVANPNPDSNLFLLQEDKNDELTPAMDIFSAGCVLAELFSDGHPPFDLSQLLAYRSAEDDDYPLDFLNNIDDVNIRNLIKAMIQRDPSKRLSAELYLDSERKRIFPEYFYSFFQSYMLIFSSPQILSPDEKVERLYKDILNVIKLLKRSEADEKGIDAEDDLSDFDCEALILIATLVTSCVRGLRFSSSKEHVLEILYHLSEHTAEETILDRILPYIMYLLQDECPRVRVLAIHTVNKCLMLIDHVPVRDANIFPEYILPALSPIVQDDAVAVRVALAQCIAQLAETSLRFLERSQLNTFEHLDVPRHSYESELANLHDTIQQYVSSLLTDQQNIVKRTLIENGIVKLCLFFGVHKSNDVLLSHMITFLNDKVDKQLRGSFFDCIAGVAGFVGFYGSPILTPLLQQVCRSICTLIISSAKGFTDSEEFVIRKAINAMSALTELGLLPKSAIYDLLKDTVCFLIHPNLWIRWAEVGFLGKLEKSLSRVDIMSRVLPILEPYLEHIIIQLEKPNIVLNSLRHCISRIVYDSTVKYHDIDLFLQTLHERQKGRTGGITAHIPSALLIPNSSKQNTAFKNFFRRLYSEGMSDKVEEKLLLISEHLRKLHKYLMNHDHQNKNTGKIDIGSLLHKIKYHTIKFDKSEISKESHGGIKKRLNSEELHLAGSMNEEWRHMFGISNSLPKNSQMSEFLHESNFSKKSDAFPSIENSFDADNAQESSYIQYRHPPCRTELGKLIRRKQEQYESSVMAKDYEENETWLPSLPPPGWKIHSSLVAHLHEHKSSVNKLVAIAGTNWFASCSSDSIVRLWDCSKMEGPSFVNRSRQSYNARGGSINSMTICRNNQSLAYVCSQGSVTVLNMATGSGKMTVLDSRILSEDEGCAVDIAYFDPGSQAVLVYATVYGYVVGWDTRANRTAWEIKNKSREGVITAMCMDTVQSCLILGTGCGYHTCIDLRFRLPISTVVHPYSARVRKIMRHPRQASWIISSVQGNNEVSIWDMETTNQHLSLWASNTPPLSKANDDQHSICAMYTYCGERSNMLLCGGTDQRIRQWCLKPRVEECQVIIPSASDSATKISYSYDDRLIDGTRVIQEHNQVLEKKDLQSDAERQVMTDSTELVPGPKESPAGHRDAITDITMCRTLTQCFLVSSSRDGVIKVWK